MYDVKITNGTIVDGTGAPRFVGDVAVKDGVIVDVSQSSLDGDAAETVDATGLLVTPGFVDIHTHYDGQATWDPLLEPSSGHGVTTVVAGNCGVGLRAGAARRRAVADLADGGRRGHPRHRAHRGHRLELGDVPRVPRRARRQDRDPDRGAELRVDLIPRRIEARGAIDVLELGVVEHVVGLEPVLERAAAAERDVLEQREVPVVDTWLADGVARRVAVVAAARRARERRECRKSRSADRRRRPRIAVHHGPDQAQARIAAAEVAAVAAVAAGEIEVVGGRQDDRGPVAA